MVFYVLFFFFFFQAEDGIRDVERSRGLGDVYKRQKLRFHQGVCSQIIFLFSGTNFYIYQNSTNCQNEGKDKDNPEAGSKFVMLYKIVLYMSDIVVHDFEGGSVRVIH
eukprot:TRINITY_DN18758_c0_g1_i1.p3 TRINITY_DN18758_c0_g1~~TRINITY_DN18758_c0_g1_i1.p3  ORF type:complete len:108 (+),score=21.39 TRINITY_DN18758_c0_g1_i1:84-407(+)